MNFDFGAVLNRAWQITWKYKVLWIFGILASCSRGSGGGSGGNGYEMGRGDRNPPFGPNSEHYFNQAGQWLADHWWVIALILLGLILLALIAIFLGTIGRIGLIRGTLQAEQGAQSLSFGELFSGALPFFWRVFGLSFLVGLVFLVIFIPLVVLGVVTAGLAFLCALPLICVLVPLAIVAGLIVELADVAIVKENLDMWAAWRRGWEMLRANLGPVLIMALILLAIAIGVGLVIALPILVIAIPAAIGFAAGHAQNWTPLIVGGVCLAAFLPVAILVNGIYNTFSGAAWTLSYLRLTPTPAAPVQPAEPKA